MVDIGYFSNQAGLISVHRRKLTRLMNRSKPIAPSSFMSLVLFADIAK